YQPKCAAPEWTKEQIQDLLNIFHKIVISAESSKHYVAFDPSPSNFKLDCDEEIVMVDWGGDIVAQKEKDMDEGSMREHLAGCICQFQVRFNNEQYEQFKNGMSHELKTFLEKNDSSESETFRLKKE
ncbi:MAG: hypothetical protein V4591_10910, partial [Bdellovibrionota bacterium]